MDFLGPAGNFTSCCNSDGTIRPCVSSDVGSQVFTAQDSRGLSKHPRLLLRSFGNTAVKFGFTAYTGVALGGWGQDTMRV